MKVSTYNVNSIKVRVENVLQWLAQTQPDVVCLQELKCETSSFPDDAFRAAGYKTAVHGQKTYNGVAILSRHALEDIHIGLPGDPDDAQARYLDALVMPRSARPIRVAALYCPNGNPVDTDKFTYKLSWFRRLHARAQSLLSHEEPLALCGDFNVIPTPEDVWDVKAMAEDALYRIESRQALRRLLNLGLTDAFRACDSRQHQYTFWDYQAGAYPKNHGFRIDHILLSPRAADRLKSAGIDASVRSWDKPSDHVPLWCEIED